MNYLKITCRKGKIFKTELQMAKEAKQKALNEAEELRKQQLIVEAQ